MRLIGRRSLALAGLVLGLALLWGCTGKQGPTGPRGPGDRTVKAGTVPIDSTVYFVPISPLNLADLPLVSVFVQVSPDEYDELPFVFQFQGDSLVTTLYASVRTGGVTLYNCQALDYVIVLIR